MKPDAVLFDLDNTLYEYGPCNEAALVAVHAQVREEVGLGGEEFRRLHDEVRLELAKRHAGLAQSHDRALFFLGMAERTGVGAARGGAWCELYWEAFCAEMRPADAAHEVLAEASARCPLALVSNQMRATQLRKLAQLDFEAYFQVVVTSEDAGVEKPDARVFRTALDALGFGVDDAVMIGDDPRADICGAHAIGLRCVQTLEFTKNGARAEDADAVIEELGALPALLFGE